MFEKVTLMQKGKQMITNDPTQLEYRIYIDEMTLLNVARKRQDGKIICQAEFRSGGEGKLCDFYTANEIFEHYHISECKLQDCILRMIDFIDGKL